MAKFINEIEINSNNIYKLIEDINLIEYCDKIINFLKINNQNLTNIRNNNFNITQNDDFYAYANNKKNKRLY
jgi:regulator of PEP synthase PpsR (kinase-PPPase family)